MNYVNDYGAWAQGDNFIPRNLAWDIQPEFGTEPVYGVIHPVSNTESIFFELSHDGLYELGVVMMIGRTPDPRTGDERPIAPETRKYAERMLAAIRAKWGEA